MLAKPITVMIAITAISCTDSDSNSGTSASSRASVVENYANLVKLNYDESLTTANAMNDAVIAFAASPTEAGLDAAKEAWLAARVPYGQSEAFRFYDGPIDDADGPEGQLNAWPMDEIYVDYVEGSPNSGLVNATTIELTKEKISGLNEGGEGDIFTTPGFDAEKSIATGYHTVEFLLWGQDNNATGPGSRSYKDYLTTAEATATNGDRRAQYLKIASELIVDDLTGLIAEWDQDTATNYRNSFFLDQDTDAALRAMFSSIGILAKGELGAERIDNALDTQEQEDEHSCFSDNTYVDIKMNALGIQNVYLGRYGVDLDGPGLNDLVAAANPTLNSEIESLMTEILEEIDALPLTFDQVIIPGDAGADGRAKLEAIVISLQQLGNKMAEAASAIGLGTISVELPE